jgi:hypothetical protein
MPPLTKDQRVTPEKNMGSYWWERPGKRRYKKKKSTEHALKRTDNDSSNQRDAIKLPVTQQTVDDKTQRRSGWWTRPGEKRRYKQIAAAISLRQESSLIKGSTAVTHTQ